MRLDARGVSAGLRNWAIALPESVGGSVGKVLGQLAIVLVYTRTVLKTQYKTQFFKDTTHFQLYYTQKQLSSIILRGDIQRMP